MGDTYMKHRHSLFIALILWLVGAPGQALSQELPGNAALVQHLSKQLPGYWKVDGLEIVAEEKSGDVRTPVSIIRYEATAHTTLPLFLETGQRVDPFALVAPSLEADTRRRLFGIMELSYSAGVWSGSVEIENPVGGLGMPVDMFSTPVIVAGSDRHNQIAEMLRSAHMSELTNQLENHIQELMVSHKARLSEVVAEHRHELERMEAEQTERLEALRSGSAPELERLKGEIEVARQELEKGFQEELAEQTTLHEGRVADLRARQETNVSEFETRLADLERDHSERLAEIRARQAGEIKELEVGFEARISSVKQQIGESNELMELQEQLISALEQHGRNYAAITELRLQVMSERSNTVRAYLGRWTGVVVCRREQWQIRFTAEAAEGQSIAGTFSYSGGTSGSVAATLNILSADLTQAVPVTLFTDTNDVFDYRGEIAEDGYIRAKVDNNDGCELTLSKDG